MSDYQVYNILDLIEAIGENEVKDILSNFSCSRNPEIQGFVKDRAIEFARKKLSITYLVMDDEGRLVGIFTLAHKVLQVSPELLSKSMRNKVARYSSFDEVTNTYTLSAFLIAQFGKNFQYDEKHGNMSGVTLMHLTLSALQDAQRRIGGGVVYLECEKDNEKLISFYEKEPNRYASFGERRSENDGVDYLQMLRLF